MMSKKHTQALVPTLRFPEFRDAGEWEEKRLGEICNIRTGKIDANAMVKDGEYRFYTCAQNYYRIDKFAFDTEALIISGNGANVGYIHYYKGKFNAYQRTYVLDKFSDSLSVQFLKKYLEKSLPKRIHQEKSESNTPYIRLSALSMMDIYMPSLEEQKKIADCLSSLDELIDAQSRKIDALREHKRGLMQQLFPAEGERVPKLRFPEFRDAGEWEEKRLGEVLKLGRGRVISKKEIEENHGIYPVFSSQTSNNGILGHINSFDFEGEYITWTTDGANAGTVFYREGRFNCTNVCGTGVPLDKALVHLKFLAYQINLIAKNYVSYVGNPKLMNNIFAEIVAFLPTLPEQKKIADCLSSLDELIDAQSRKIDALREHKRGLMQQLFPAEGERVPKLRFPEFRDAGEWEEKRLGEVGQTISGLSGKSRHDFGTGESYVTYKQVFDNAQIDLSKCKQVQIADNENQNKLQYGDVLFTTSSETPNEVGYASVLLNRLSTPLYLNSFCFAFRTNKSNILKPEFSCYLFHSFTYRKLIGALAQGITRFNISKGAFLDLKLPIPTLPEQKKIADCLSSLDEVIDAQSRKIDALREHKRGLMQQLFPTEGERS